MAPLSDREICFAALALSCASYLQPLCLSFLFWRMGIIRVSPFTVTDKAPDMCGCTAWHKTWAQSAPLAMSSITTHIPYLQEKQSGLAGTRRGWRHRLGTHLGTMAFPPHSRRQHWRGMFIQRISLKVSNYLINDHPTKGFCSKMMGLSGSGL